MRKKKTVISDYVDNFRFKEPKEVSKEKRNRRIHRIYLSRVRTLCPYSFTRNWSYTSLINGRNSIDHGMWFVIRWEYDETLV